MIRTNRHQRDSKHKRAKITDLIVQSNDDTWVMKVMKRSATPERFVVSDSGCFNHLNPALTFKKLTSRIITASGRDWEKNKTSKPQSSRGEDEPPLCTNIRNCIRNDCRCWISFQAVNSRMPLLVMCKLLLQQEQIIMLTLPTCEGYEDI